MLGGGTAEPDPDRPPRDPGRGAGLEATFGQAPVYIREGGSIPVCATFEEVLGLPVVLLGFTAGRHAHAPNEWMDLGNYETAIRTVARLWDEIAASGRRPDRASLAARRRLSSRKRSGTARGRTFGSCVRRFRAAVERKRGATMHNDFVDREDERA